jgi:hypothetical protein
MRSRITTKLGLFVILAAGSALPQQEIPQQSATLIESDPPVMRLTVEHTHAFSVCWGILDFSRDSIRYTSLTEPGRSFTYPRSAISRATPWGAYFVRIYTHNGNHSFIAVDPMAVRNRVDVDSPQYRNLAHRPDTIVAFSNDFDGSLAKERARLAQSREQAAAAPPANSPQPALRQQQTARLHVFSQPGGAQVYLDGVFKGVTSEAGELMVESAPGAHTLRADHTEYKEWKQSVSLPATGESDVHVTMERSGPKPLGETDVEDALTNGLTKNRVIALVKQYGVDFVVNAETEQRLRSKGADGDLLLAIAQNKR